MAWLLSHWWWWWHTWKCWKFNSGHLQTGNKTLPEVMLPNCLYKCVCYHFNHMDSFFRFISLSCEIGINANLKLNMFSYLCTHILRVCVCVCILSKMCVKWCVTGLLHCFIARPKTDICGGRPVTAAYAILIWFPWCARCAGSRHFCKDTQLCGKSALKAKLRDSSGINPLVIML